MSTRTVPRGTDETPVRTRKRRARTLKVRPVSLELDETTTHYLVYVQPHLEARVLGLSPHRARLRKCSCEYGPSGRVGTALPCANCRGWDVWSVTSYLVKLLRSYPTVRMAAVEPERTPPAQEQRMPGSMRWVHGLGWVAA